MPPPPGGRRLLRAAARAARLACPRCGGRPLFAGWFRIRERCPACRLRLERAQGYWVGAIYVNYAVTALVAVGGAFALWGLGGLAPARQLPFWIPFCVLFPLWFLRYSRSVWLALDHLVNPAGGAEADDE